MKTLTYDEWIIFIRSNSDISSLFIIHHSHFSSELHMLIHPALLLILHPYSSYFILTLDTYLSLILISIHPNSWYLFILIPDTYLCLNLILIHPYSWYLFILTPDTYPSLNLILIHSYSWYLCILTPDTYASLLLILIHPYS